MKETINKLNTARIYWEMQHSTILVRPEDTAKVKVLFPLVPLEMYQTMVNIRYDLPLLVESPKVDVNLKVETELPKGSRAKS